MSGVSFGQYELVRRMARGGMAEIYLAVEQGVGGLRRPVVVKRILPDRAGSTDFLAMFMDEARLAARLSHPNVAHLYNFGEIDGTYFLAMELVEGLTLGEILRRIEPERIPLELALRTMADVCAGLHYAHELTDEAGQPLGVVHRDVSPSNVMISRNGEAKLLDFGVALAVTKQHETVSGELKGKLGYMAPEQFTGEAVDRRSDVFAAGVVLCEVASGRRLYQRESDAAAMHAIVYGELLIDPAWALPEDVAAIVRKALAKRPEERFATARDMQLALEEALARFGGQVSPLRLGGFVEHLLEGEPLPWALPAVGAELSAVDLEVTAPSMPPEHGVTTETPAVLPAERRSRGRAGPVLGAVVGFLVAASLFAATALWLTADRSGGDLPTAPNLASQPLHAKVPPAPTTADGSPLVVGPPTGPGLGAEADAGEAAEGDAGAPEAPPADASLSGDGRASREGVVTPRGTLFLDTRPWTKVRAGGRSLGNTPVMGARLPAGSHVLTLTDGQGRHHRRRVRIRPGEATKLFLVLDR